MVRRLSEERILALTKHHSNGSQTLMQCTFKNCARIFSTSEDLKLHKEMHLRRMKIPCTICCYRFTNNSMFKRHMRRTHSQTRLYKCDVPGCSYSGKDSLYLLRHKREVHTAILNTCLLCGKITKSHYYHKLHVANHNTDTPGVFKCIYMKCTQLFQSGDDLRKHADETHKRTEKFYCNECGKCVASKYTLSYHIQLHWAKRSFKCDTPGCSYAAKKINELQRHKTNVHRLNLLTCCHCGLKIKSIPSLKQHLDKHESANTPDAFKCHHVDCHATFSKPSDLMVHVEQHIEKRECDVPGCSYTSNLLNEMQLHRMNDHSIWPHSCQVCNRSFIAERYLKQHMSTVHKNRESKEFNWCNETLTSGANPDLVKDEVDFKEENEEAVFD
jgi:hypothetical protein